MRVFTSGLMVFTILFPPVVLAAPREKVNVQYYDIEGRTKKELIKEMKKKGVHDGGKHFHANTHWRVTWNYDYAPSSDGCRAHSVKTDLDIDFLLPRWVPPAGVSQDLMKKWETYYAALKTHEEGHADMGRKAAQEIEEKLWSLGPGLACPQFQKAANQEGGRIIDRYRKEDSDYDKRTQNGRKQGAFLD